MSKTCEISVIIPIYNVEQYLEKCVDSVLHQTFQNIEIILVNDGSTDKSDEIINRYITEYPEIVKGVSKCNGGLSSARNWGLDNAIGKYITFLDSDDYLDPDYLETLYYAAETKKLDMVCGGQRKVDEFETVLKVLRYPIEENPNTILRRLNISGKLYKHELIENYHARFPIGKTYEDNPFNLLMLFVAEKIELIDYNGYNQLVRRGSITTAKIKKEQLPYEALENTVKFITENKIRCNDYEVFEYTVMSFFTYFIFQAHKKNGYLKQGKSRKSDIEVVLEFCEFTTKVLTMYMPSYYKNRNLNIFRNRELQISQRLGTAVYAYLCKTKLLKIFTEIYYYIS